MRATRDENPPEHWDLRPALTAYTKPLLLAMADGEETNVTIRVFEGQRHNLHRTDFAHFARVIDEFLHRTD